MITRILLITAVMEELYVCLTNQKSKQLWEDVAISSLEVCVLFSKSLNVTFIHCRYPQTTTLSRSLLPLSGNVNELCLSHTHPLSFVSPILSSCGPCSASALDLYE